MRNESYAMIVHSLNNLRPKNPIRIEDTTKSSLKSHWPLIHIYKLWSHAFYKNAKYFARASTASRQYVKGIEKREYFRSLQSANLLFFLSPTLLPHKNNNTLMHRFRCGAICIFINYSGARGCWASPCVHYFSQQQTGTPRNLNRRTRAINHAPAA
jgi:hypothetical protein